MKYLLLSLLIGIPFINSVSLNAQYVLHTNDTIFKYSFPIGGEKIKKNFESDTIRIGTEAYQNSFVVYAGSDSIVVSHDKSRKREDQFTYITIVSPVKKTVVRVAYWAMAQDFSDEYIKTQTGKASFEIPEVYELANIILALAIEPLKLKGYILSKTAYYKEVMNHFLPYQQHPLIQALGLKNDNDLMDKYYSFRENSYCFKIKKDDKVVLNNQYYKVFLSPHSKIFEQNLALINDFVAKSDFRTFYNSHRTYYEELIKQTASYMPMQAMWKWLEQEFPGRVQSYKTIFSPLIDGNHSTQGYTSFRDLNKPFTERLMFVCGSGIYDGNTKYTQKQIEGFMSGIVFTEIDHNYVNPVTDRYLNRVNKIFGNRSVWVSAGKSDWYKNAYNVFNEYMTHALFLVYLLDTGFPADAYDLARTQRISMNEKGRGFHLFENFSDHLIELYKARPAGKKIVDLYPAILDWCEQQKVVN